MQPITPAHRRRLDRNVREARAAYVAARRRLLGLKGASLLQREDAAGDAMMARHWLKVALADAARYEGAPVVAGCLMSPAARERAIARGRLKA